VVRADRPDQVHVSGAAHAGHLRAERPGDLYGERSHATRRTVDQHLLPRLYPPQVAHAHQGGVPGQRHRSRLLQRQVGRFQLDHPVRDAHVLGERSVGFAEHLVAGTEPGHAAADRLHPTREVPATDLRPGPAEPEHQARQVRVAPHDVPVSGVDRGRVNPHQHLVVGGHRLGDLPDLQYVW
jgi:hypothetical protein